MARTEPLPNMADAAFPLYAMAYMISHEDESVREAGVYLLAYTALGYVQYLNYLNHIRSCPQCIFRQKVIDLLLGREGVGDRSAPAACDEVG